MKRDLVAIDDLSDEAILGLMDLADELRSDIRGHANELAGFLMGSLFLEPSTRTRLSFEAAMLRLGGKVITSSDPNTSSAAKGETLADTVRIVDSYVDVTVLRHPAAGAARLAARVARGPVINAGDGSHEHPTQTLCDLYALRCERGRLERLTVVLYGDLRYGRTTHSLARALVRFGATILAISQGDLGLPDFVVRDLLKRSGYGSREVLVDDLEEVFRRRDVRALLIAPQRELPAPERGGAPPSAGLAGRTVDAIYVTRLQKERLREGTNVASLPILDHRFLASRPFEDTVVLHPLPRVSEIAVEVDESPRAAYFRQAALGVPIRMALLRWAAGTAELPGRSVTPAPPKIAGERRCANPGCISVLEPASVPPEVGIRDGDVARCLYCEEPADGA